VVFDGAVVSVSLVRAVVAEVSITNPMLSRFEFVVDLLEHEPNVFPHCQQFFGGLGHRSPLLSG
jgi:hypothetical protein